MQQPQKPYKEQSEGIEASELLGRRQVGECQRCAWPTDRKRGNKTSEGFRWTRVEKGTAPYPKKGSSTKTRLRSRAVHM